ncbi:hypothetical protein [uncultured Bacteroides sp.]|uniref:hypothetical protein n=1 Tax=uncultured Bacteroides sp. TaxID=162156 RepID=UPI002AA68CBD|nr:hypothetical protein [uncultured Bacteroides sp.]
MLKIDNLSTDSKIAIIAAIAAIVSALIAFMSYITARGALRLSKRQYNENQSNFNLYYNEGFGFIPTNGENVKRLLLFHLTIRNKSKFRNTLKADLEIEYLRADDSVNRITIEHKPELQNFLKAKSLTVFPEDIAIEANTTSTKWLIFEQPSLIDKTHRIEKYDLKLTDLNGKKSSIESVLIKDVE